MGFLLGFGLLLAGYSLVDWGYQRAKSRKVSMWYLVSGQGAGPSTTQTDLSPIFQTENSNALQGVARANPIAQPYAEATTAVQAVGAANPTSPIAALLRWLGLQK